MTDIRPATPADAPQCAAILQGWLDSTDWMPNLHNLAETTDFASDFLIGTCDTYVTGAPVDGFISLEDDNGIAALYVAEGARNAGLGGALLDVGKSLRDDLNLWVFQANNGAIRFYQRHGFAERRRTDGDNDEGLPDIFMEWRQ